MIATCYWLIMCATCLNVKRSCDGEVAQWFRGVLGHDEVQSWGIFFFRQRYVADSYCNMEPKGSMTWGLAGSGHSSCGTKECLK
jgi:hypothetical protein